MNGPESALLVLQAPPGDLASELRARGAGAVECTSGDAPRLLGTRPFQVVVVSIDAFSQELWDAARASDPRAQLVVAAPGDRLLDAVELLRRGASDVLVEPLAADALAAAIARATERHAGAGAAALAAEAIRSSIPPRLGGTVAHELANRVAVLISSVSAIESALANVAELDALLAAGDASRLASWWQEHGRDAAADAREATSEANDVTDRLRGLARDLRAVLRVDASARTPFEMGDALATALRLARPALAPVARVELALPPRTGASGSSGAFARAVLELLLSSADAFAAANARGGHVRVGWRSEEGRAVLVVEDDAPAAAQPHALLPVAIARDLAERQGGSLVERRSASGVGRVFELSLPAAAGTTA